MSSIRRPMSRVHHACFASDRRLGARPGKTIGNFNKTARGIALRVKRSHPMKMMADAPRRTTHLITVGS